MQDSNTSSLRPQSVLLTVPWASMFPGPWYSCVRKFCGGFLSFTLKIVNSAGHDMEEVSSREQTLGECRDLQGCTD